MRARPIGRRDGASGYLEGGIDATGVAKTRRILLSFVPTVMSGMTLFHRPTRSLPGMPTTHDPWRAGHAHEGVDLVCSADVTRLRRPVRRLALRRTRKEVTRWVGGRAALSSFR